MAGLMETDYGQGWFDADSPVPRGLARQQGPQGTPRYAADESQKMDPNKMLWAGTIMDIGNAFGNALAGTGASQGNAMRLYGHARDSNQALDDRAIAMNEQMRQRQLDMEDRALNHQLIESRISKNTADINSVPRPKPIGSPQRMADGTLAQTVQQPDGSITMEPLGDFANEGRVVTVAGVPYFLDDRTNQLTDLGQGTGGGGQPISQPQAEDLAPGQAKSEPQSQGPKFTPESVSGQEAQQQAAIERAKADAKREAEREVKVPEWQTQLQNTENQIKNIRDLKANIDDVGFGMIEGRITGGMPVFGSEYDDLFDAISNSQILKNAEQMTGILSDSDISLLRSMGLDRTRGREFNERQINELMGVYENAAKKLRDKLGISNDSDDDLINRYLD